MQPIVELFDPLAFGLVWFGSIAVVGLQEGRASLLQGFFVWQILFRANPTRDAQSSRQALTRIKAVTDAKGLQCIDHVGSKNPFVARASAYFASDQNTDRFASWANTHLQEREVLQTDVVRFWTAVADVAPAIGMIGTIIGLVRLFADIDNAANLGSAMALALLTTLYGLLLSNVVAAPISHRFQRLSAEELKWQRMFVDELTALAMRSEKST
ncbi:hypothetical protein GCM10009096_07860 [Parasphingorhabdus litoris]|uniref:MotA/TolQ/ExbB proton channel domain-containing protein n=1 Tax=Parasphingorhabdus litoris TaxID=394733 RepID=A0ABN1A7A5_9SPHN|nr:MotA/TolQ/ExbB proton channel family protein [Parasphingorhabdus litoris]